MASAGRYLRASRYHRSTNRSESHATITKAPPSKTDEHEVKYKFASSEPGSSFQCKLDKKPFQPCTSPKKVKVDEGRHMFRVRAIDAAGNADPTAATDKFKVVD